MRKENLEKKLEEWDLFKPESERVVNQTIP